MRRQQGGSGRGRGAQHARPWWETDKSQISPPPQPAAGSGGRGAQRRAATVSTADGISSGGGVAVPRLLASPAEGRQEPVDRYAYKARGTDASAADRRRDAIGRTPPPGSSGDAGLAGGLPRGQTFSPSRSQTPNTATREAVVRKTATAAGAPGAGAAARDEARQLQLTARPNPAAVYGFVGWIGTITLFVLYLLWAYLPVELLHSLGVTYYPSRYWAVALPAYVCVIVLFVFTTYNGFCLMVNPPLDSFSTFTDKHALDRPKDWGGANAEGTETNKLPPLFDIPIGEVNRLLYQRAQPGQRMAT